MVVEGASSPSNGASVGGGGGVEDDDGDLLPLSSIFRRLRKRMPQQCSAGLSKVKKSRKRRPIRAGVVGLGALEGSRNVREDEGENGRSACAIRGSFAPGDIVWAKAFPHTWWPGWIRQRRGLGFLVSFFGGDRSQWLQESSIRGFEDSYLQMSRMGGARLACRIDCALAEVGRRTALGMACGCRGVKGVAEKDLITQIGRERERFEPAETLEFVLRLATCAWVDDGEITSAVRLAAQVNAFRSHVSVARLGDVKGGFQPEEMLDTVRGLAVLAWVDDEAATGIARVVSQLHTYRHFVSIRPDLVNQNPAEGDSATSDYSEGSSLEMSVISLSETEETEYPPSLRENDVEEWDKKDSMMQEELQLDGEFCTMSRIDYSIFSSNTEFEPLSDSKMDDVHNRSGQKGLAFDTEKTCDVSPMNDDHHNWICNLINGLVSSDSGQILCLSKNMSEREQDDEFNVANAVAGDVELSSNVKFDKSSVSIDSTDASTKRSNSPCRYASCVDRFHQTVAPNSSDEMNKAADFSLADASSSCSLEFRTENNAQLFVDFSLKPQPSIVADMFHGEEGGLQFLQEMLYYLYSLASDPLYMRSESLLPLCQLVLSHRASMLQNISSPPSVICTVESQNAQELDLWGHNHLMDGGREKHHDDKIAGMCGDSNIAGVLHTCDDGSELQSDAECHSNLHVPYATGDNIPIRSSNNINMTSKTVVDRRCIAGIKRQSNVEKRLSGKVVRDKRYTAADIGVAKGVSHLTSPASHDCEIVTQKRRFDHVVTFATSINSHAANYLGSDVKASTMSGNLADNRESNDKKAVYIKRSDMSDETEVLLRDSAGYDATIFQSNGDFSAAANASGNSTESTAEACSSALPPICRYEVSSCRKRRLDQPIHSYNSEWQKNHLFTSATQLYASPLVRDSLSAVDGAQCSPLMGRRTHPSNSLHMKFPKGFNLPSKEDLEETFRVFGPLDHSRTRVFFYTGAGKVVFLNPVDAETAYNYLRRNEVFETSMRFWLGTHEKLRNEYSDRALSLSGGEMSAVGPKSCLKTSTVNGNENARKKCRVRFCT